MAPHILLEELGVPYELSRVELGKPRDEAFLSLNPWGRVPTLVTEGKVIYESAAICMHLTDCHPEKGLAPALGTMERASFYQWLLFLSDTLQPAFMRIYRSSRFSTDPAHEPAVKEKARRDIAEIWSTLDRLLAGKTWLAGERFSAADIYFHMLFTWDENMAGMKHRHSNLAGLFDRIHGRPAVERIAALNM
jgi:glutathione S-transferase